MDIFSKLKFILKKPKVVIVTGAGRDCAKEAIFEVLKPHFDIGREILIFDSDFSNPSEREKFIFLLKNSPLSVFVATHINDIPFAKNFFGAKREEIEKIIKITKTLPSNAGFILNFDDEAVREMKEETNVKETTFGFGEGADFKASDINLNSGTNFKINYRGSVVPVWLETLFGKEQIYSALSAAAVGAILGLNLVEISQALKNYRSLPGKMRLIKGVKGSKILDDSESATVFSTIEALDILGKIKNPEQGRRIAVLGDVLGIGKYATEAHQSIGEKAKNCSDLLFIFGPRAKFIRESAITEGMAFEKIFNFDTIKEGLEKLRNELGEGDLVLVDGSKEMKMGKIVEEIKV